VSVEQELPGNDPRRGSGQGLVKRQALSVGLGLGQSDDTLTRLETAALLEQLNALIALQYAAFGSDGAATFKTGMLAHGSWTMEV